MEDDTYMHMSPEQLARDLHRSQEERELYDRVRGSGLYRYTRFLRLHKRVVGVGAGVLAVATGAYFFICSNQPTEDANTTLPPPAPASSEPFTPSKPLTSSAEVSIRDPQSTISIRSGLSLEKTRYVCEDLVQSALKQRRTCSQAEQTLFDDSRAQLESFSNSPQVYAAFPPKYQPADRSAMGFMACVMYQQGASAGQVAEDIMQWYPVATFNAGTLANLSQQKICSQY